MSIKPHAFVAMPFGVKPGPQQSPLDFNRVYLELIKPAIETAGLVAFRADEETRAGDIRVDMFQELLLADLVVVDVSIDNPNVWYELGVRHALRARGVVLISGGRTTKAFDIYTDRKLNYGIRDGGPDPASLDADREALCRMIVETMASWHERKVSPVYKLLPNLIEPDWRTLRVGDVREYWDAYDAWERRIVLARQEDRIGDMLVLADEGPVAAFRADAWIRAGKALRNAHQFQFAIEQLDKGLSIDPDNANGLREKGICLQRLALQGTAGYTLDRARNHYQAMLATRPGDAETRALLGRVDKDAWVQGWRLADSTPAQRREEAREESAYLRRAIDGYLSAFKDDPKHYYSGINALTLMHLHEHLNEDDRYRDAMDIVAGAVRFSAECEQREEQLYWSHATLGDLEVLTGTPQSVAAAYREAVAINRKDRFALGSTRDQLLLLDELGFAPDNVAAGVAVFDRALSRLPTPNRKWEPERVFLFSGHMVDAADRGDPRLPEAVLPLAAERIGTILRALDAGAGDLALTQGACGGDLLFSEACHDLGVRICWQQPFDEPEFITRSVVRGGEHWRERYYAARQHLAFPVRSAPAELGAPPAYSADTYAFERCNLWLLYTALAHGVDKVHFVCLWNGAGGDGPGGTAHMYQEVARRTGQVHWVDTRKL